MKYIYMSLFILISFTGEVSYAVTEPNAEKYRCFSEEAHEFNTADMEQSSLSYQCSLPLDIPINCTALSTHATHIKGAYPNAFRETIKTSFKDMNKLFFQENLLPLVKDTTSAPQPLISKGIACLQEYNECVQDFCVSIMNTVAEKCGKGWKEILPQYQWCKQKAKELSQLQHKNVEFIITQNIRQKSRSLIFEAMTRFGYEMDTLIYENINSIVVQLIKASNSITRIIQNTVSS